MASRPNPPEPTGAMEAKEEEMFGRGILTVAVVLILIVFELVFWKKLFRWLRSAND